MRVQITSLFALLCTSIQVAFTQTQTTFSEDIKLYLSKIFITHGHIYDSPVISPSKQSPLKNLQHNINDCLYFFIINLDRISLQLNDRHKIVFH